MNVPKPLRIVDYDERWPQEFGRLHNELRDVIGGDALRIDHVGSTAVPGLAAKQGSRV